MLYNLNLKKYFAVVLSIIMILAISISGFAEPGQHGGSKGPGRAPAQGVKKAPPPAAQKSFVDSRYRHNRSYPVRGESFRTLPRDHRVVRWDRSRYYHHHGVWYRHHGSRYVVVAPPIGLFVPFLPLFYTTVWFHGIPYYYANATYYTSTPGGYVVVEPPQGDVSEAPPASSENMENRLFIYPRKGQSQAQQDNDRYECHKWAVDQTNYDPTAAIPQGLSANQAMQMRADYQRAMAACLDGRGYTVK
ncbi:MAG: hypothetical protein APR62_06910 [Smithella sp. SDB]|nr:MAG: hypothetical protein APR62_06910 [Smithella sp. SDB]